MFIALLKPRTVTFVDDIIHCGNDRVPNPLNKGNYANSKTITQRHKAKITVIWKPGILHREAVIGYTNISD